jgi:hypothetical protein
MHGGALEHGPPCVLTDGGWTMRVSDRKSSEITGRATSSVGTRRSRVCGCRVIVEALDGSTVGSGAPRDRR